MELTKRDKILILINLCLLLYFVTPAAWYIRNIPSLWFYTSVFEMFVSWMFIVALFALLISVTRVKLKKLDKILILIVACSFFVNVAYYYFAATRGITEDMVLYANLVEFIAYIYIVALFVLLVSVVTKMELTGKDKMLVSVILCLFSVHVIHGMLNPLSVLIYHHGLYTVFTSDFIGGLFVLFVWSWGIMILSPIFLVLEHALAWQLPYTICCILAWISLFVLIRYTKGMKLVPRIVYLYLIPALVMSLAYLYQLPLH